MIKEARNIRYENIKVGDVFSFEEVISSARIAKFAEISGDYNPLHIDNQYAESTEFKKPISHGLLAASFFSRLIGMYCPGRKALYISQDIHFRQPIFVGEAIIVEGRVTNKLDFGKVVELETKIILKSTGQTAIDGLARAKFIS